MSERVAAEDMKALDPAVRGWQDRAWAANAARNAKLGLAWVESLDFIRPSTALASVEMANGSVIEFSKDQERIVGHPQNIAYNIGVDRAWAAQSARPTRNILFDLMRHKRDLVDPPLQRAARALGSHLGRGSASSLKANFGRRLIRWLGWDNTLQPKVGR